jgi:hypothetical protein
VPKYPYKILWLSARILFAILGLENGVENVEMWNLVIKE